jgi:hypothetical protein
MSATKEQCEAYVRNSLANIRRIPIQDRNFLIYLPRDVLFYCWLIQFTEGSITRRNLDFYLGTSLKLQIESLLETTLIPNGFFARVTPNFLMLSNEMMEACAEVFNDKPEENFQIAIEAPISFLPALKGYEYIQAINQVRDDVNIQELVKKAFHNILPNAISSGDDGIYLFVQPNLYQFILAVVPNEGAFKMADFKDVALQLGNMRDRSTIDAPILLIAPDAEDGKIHETTINYPLLYHCWSVATLILLNGIQQLQAIHGVKRVEEEFMAIFPPERIFPFSANAALARLKKNLNSAAT